MVPRARRGRRAAPGSRGRRAVVLALALLLAAALLAGCGGESAAPEPRARGAAFVPEVAGAVAAPPPRAPRSSERRPRGRFLVARVTRPTWLRATRGGRRLARIGRTTEFGSARVLGVVGRHAGWLRVLAAERPNGARAWIPARSARLAATDVWLEVDRSRRELRLRDGRRTIRRLPVAVGRPDTPTPTGRFAVTDKLRPSRPGSPYGCCALALTGHQTKLQPGWPGGDRLAIHGTPLPQTIGEAASLGCLRAHARDLRALLRAVPLGAPVVIRA